MIVSCCEIDGKIYYIQVKDSLSGVDVVFDFSNRWALLRRGSA